MSEHCGKLTSPRPNRSFDTSKERDIEPIEEIPKSMIIRVVEDIFSIAIVTIVLIVIAGLMSGFLNSLNTYLGQH